MTSFVDVWVRTHVERDRQETDRLRFVLWPTNGTWIYSLVLDGDSLMLGKVEAGSWWRSRQFWLIQWKGNDMEVLTPPKGEIKKKHTFCYQKNVFRPLRYFLVCSLSKTLGVSGMSGNGSFFWHGLYSLMYFFHTLWFIFSLYLCIRSTNMQNIISSQQKNETQWGRWNSRQNEGRSNLDAQSKFWVLRDKSEEMGAIV